MQSTGGRLATGAAWIGLTRTLINALAFISTIILARILAPEDFGLIAVVTSVTAILGSVTELSLGTALIQHSSPEERHFHTAWTLNLVRAGFLGLVTAAIAYPLAAIYGDPRIAPILLLLGASTVVTGCMNIKLVIFERELIFWQSFVLSGTSKLLSFTVTVVIALIYRSYWALVIGSITYQVSLVAVSYTLKPYRPRFSVSAYRELLSFSIWLTLGNGVRQINSQSDPLAIAFFVSTPTLGYYSMGDRLGKMPLFETLSPLRNILFPAFSRLKDDLPRLRAAYLRAQRMICTLAIPIGLGFATVAEPVIRLLVGEKWLPSVPIVQALSIIYVGLVIDAVEPLAMALGQSKALFQRDIRVLIVRLPCMLSGLAVGSATTVGAINGLLCGLALATAVNMICNLRLASRLMGASILEQAKVALRPALAATAMLGVVLALQSQSPAVSAGLSRFIWLAGLVGIGAVVYVGGLITLWLAHGKPDGAEKDMFEMARKYLLRINKRRKRPRPIR